MLVEKIVDLAITSGFDPDRFDVLLNDADFDALLAEIAQLAPDEAGRVFGPDLTVYRFKYRGVRFKRAVFEPKIQAAD